MLDTTPHHTDGCLADFTNYEQRTTNTNNERQWAPQKQCESLIRKLRHRKYRHLHRRKHSGAGLTTVLVTAKPLEDGGVTSTQLMGEYVGGRVGVMNGRL